jgi:hypothetical protein
MKLDIYTNPSFNLMYSFVSIQSLALLNVESAHEILPVCMLGLKILEFEKMCENPKPHGFKIQRPGAQTHTYNTFEFF